VTHTYIQAIKHPTLHYLTRSVRRRAATSKRRYRKSEAILHRSGYPDYTSAVASAILANDQGHFANERDSSTRAVRNNRRLLLRRTSPLVQYLDHACLDIISQCSIDMLAPL